MQWHESIGVTLLNALGLPDEIVDSTIDHDQPRTTPTALRTLSDVVYVANVLACAHFDWLYPDFDPERGDIGLVRSSFADILPEIENDAQEMMAVFS